MFVLPLVILPHQVKNFQVEDIGVDDIFKLIDRLHHMHLGGRALKISFKAVLGETGPEMVILGIAVNGFLELAELQAIHQIFQEVQERRKDFV
jgi:hypothetical protein